MADYGALAKKLVADAIMNRIPGLNRKATFALYNSAGVFDPEQGVTVPDTTIVPDVVCVLTRPEFKDVAGAVVATDGKLLVPGTSLPRQPKPDVDIVTMAGEEWRVRDVKPVGEGALYIVFVYRT